MANTGVSAGAKVRARVRVPDVGPRLCATAGRSSENEAREAHEALEGSAWSAGNMPGNMPGIRRRSDMAGVAVSLLIGDLTYTGAD
jgi:hypothetical protein